VARYLDASLRSGASRSASARSSAQRAKGFRNGDFVALGPDAGASSSESALPACEVPQCPQEVDAAELGPVRVNEHAFGIGGLP
jgi:hypothetical protein